MQVGPCKGTKEKLKPPCNNIISKFEIVTFNKEKLKMYDDHKWTIL
jgi:hypothetical protein